MDIVREADRLSREFLEEDIKRFELDLAVNGSKYSNTIEEFIEVFGQQNADKFHHLEFYESSIDMERDEYIESIRSEKYSVIFNELDKFLNAKNIDLDRESAEYQLLSRRFVETKIDAAFYKIKIIRGVQFKYSSVDLGSGKVNINPTYLNEFQKMERLSWDEVIFKILSNELIEIKARGFNGKYTFQEMGFKDRRSVGKANKTWATLLAFGNQEGGISWNNCQIIKKEHQLKKDVQRISAILKSFMGIDNNPFKTYHKSRGYETKFRFYDSRYS